MQWSQLKKRIEATFADSVKDRVELHTTRYHKAHDQMGRAWITFDGEEIINMCSFTAEMAQEREVFRQRVVSGCKDWQEACRQYNEAEAFVRNQGLFARPEFHQALFSYLNLSIDQILTSPDPIIRAIGMLDKRTGKRRLTSLGMASEHPLVRRLHRVRCEAEELATGGHERGERPAML